MQLNLNQPVSQKVQASRMTASQHSAVSSRGIQPLTQGNVLFQAKKTHDSYAYSKVVPDLNMKRVIPSFILGGAAILASCLFLAPLLPALVFAVIPGSILIGTFWLAGVLRKETPTRHISTQEAVAESAAYDEAQRLKWQASWNKLKSFFGSS